MTLDQKCKSLLVPALIWGFPCKTATLGQEIQVSIGPSPHLLFCAFTTTTLWPELIVSMGPRPHLSFCAIKTAWLAPELLVSMDLSPHLWFLHAKQRLLDQNCKTLWVPALLCGFCIENSGFSTRIVSLPEILVSMGPRHHLSLCACKTTWLASESLVSMGPSHHLLFLHAKQRL